MRKLTVSASIMCATLAALSNSAFGQYRVGDQGHVNDANNRLGSGGYNQNSDASQRGAGVTNNQIVHGNVSGLGYFHGNTDTFSPYQVQTSTQNGASSRLDAIAAPQNLSARTTGAPQGNITPYYNAQRVNALPSPNFVQTPGGVGLVPGPAAGPRPVSDQRLGVIGNVTTDHALPAAGEYSLPGPIDATGQASAMTASPVYGIRRWNSDDPNDQYFLSRYSNTQLQQGDGRPTDNATVQRMRNELNSTIVNPDAHRTSVDDPHSDTGSAPGQPQSQRSNNTNVDENASGIRNAQIGQPGSGEIKSKIANRPLSSAVNASAENGSLQTGAGLRQTLLLPAGEQSAQLAELQRRMKTQGASTDQQANTDYNHAVRLKADAERKSQEKKSNGATAGNGTDTSKTGSPLFAGSGASGAAAGQSKLPTYVAPPVEKTPANTPASAMVNAPLAGHGTQSDYVITSLSTGVKAQGLAKLLKSAETDMRAGKFTTALDSYDTAAAVAPNNPFVTLGRAFAELGASYYGKAEADLRRTIVSEPAVLVGRYDMRGFLGEDRLHFVTADLSEIATSEKKSSRAPFLLGYLAHNNGNDQSAATQLAEALRREGGQDAVIAQMQKLWNLPTK